MNYDNLHAIIERYENDFDFIYGKNGEMLKWRALKAWQDAFHSPERKGSFKEKFNAAKKTFSFFVDNSYEHPSTGIIKLWEKEPEKMEHLFLEVLLGDPCGDAAKAESNMLEFLDEFEILRCKHFPEAGSYKVTPHSASVFMTLDNPSFNYFFRISVARKMANYIGFEDDLGDNKKLNLVNFYKMCGEIVSAMKEHENLFPKHASYLTEEMTDDPEHHLMVFDLLHCSGYRGYYTGLVPTNIGKSKSRKAYRDLKTDEVITLSYNPSAVNVPTVSQRPDNVLRLEKKGAETDYEYIFDAKYRINPAVEGTDYYLNISKKPGPEVDDINTMHRYRDAIVYHHGASPFERTMFGAYVLFPYANEEEYRNHRFFESIDKVNIGGLPFLPTATSMVTDMLDDLIDDSPESAFERATLPKGIEGKLKKVDWSRRDVLIGQVRNREQMDACLAHHFYYVPVSGLSGENLPIHEVALYQSRSMFGSEAGIEYYGEVLSIERIKRREITEIPRDSDFPYYRLNIKEWIPLGRRIEVKEYGVKTIAFTNHFLLKHCTLVTELFIKSEEEFRFLMELKRKTSDAALINDDNVTGFEFGEYRVIFEDGEIKLLGHSGMVGHCKINDFVRKPNAQFRGLTRSMNWE